jgi:glycosyltransferase involved in cell wall biosynthesis
LKPLSILEICLSRSWGGLEMYAASVGEWLQERGHRVSMITLTGSPIVEVNKEKGIPVVEVARKDYLWLPTIWIIAKYIKAFLPNVIQVHLSKDLWHVAMAQWLSKPVPVVFSQQMTSSYPKRDILHRIVWNRVSRVAALTEEIKNKTIESTSIPAHRVQVIPYGIDTDKLKPSPELRPLLRKHHGISENQVVIGVVGRLDPGKGQDVFLEALSRVSNSENVLGLLIGEETYSESGFRAVLDKLIQKWQLQDKVRFLNFITNPLELYPMLDVLVLPSRKETFGKVLIEAMAFGLPVIATKAGGVPEIVVDNETGILVSANDPISLANVIDRLSLDQELRIKLGQKGRERAVAQYQLSDHLDKLEDLLGQAVSENA